LLLAAMTLAVFLPVARYGYVNYDDSDYVTANAHVQSGLNWENVGWALKSGHASNWHPLTWMSHMLDVQLFGENPGAQHLVSLGFHIADTLLLFLLLRRMTGALWRSVMVAGLFALHPLHVESVAWISERKDVLSAFFFLLTLGAYGRYAECRRQNVECRRQKEEGGSQKPASRAPVHVSRFRAVPGAVWYLVALVCFALGLMSKPMLVTLPFVLLLVDFWPLQRFGSSANGARAASAWRLLVEKAPFFLLAAASSVVTFIAQRKGGAVSTSLSLGARVANAVVSYIRYIGKMLWPRDLSILYPHPGHWPAWEVTASVVLLVAICAGVILLARKRPYLAMGWLWFCGTLVPVIGLVQVGIQSMADRYTYLPLIGLFIMLVWGSWRLLENRAFGREVAAALAVLSISALATAAWLEIGFWKDSVTLFRHAVEVTTDNFVAEHNLAFSLASDGRLEEAVPHYRESLHLEPRNAVGYYNLGLALAGLRRPEDAASCFANAARQSPRYAEAHYSLGAILLQLNQPVQAREELQAALKLSLTTEYASQAHFRLGMIAAIGGEFGKARDELTEALRLNPAFPEARDNLARVTAQLAAR
jgi:Flp pilus assembly protein TadD